MVIAVLSTEATDATFHHRPLAYVLITYLHFGHNVSLSRNLCAVCIVVQWSDSETTMQTARKLSVCSDLLCVLLHLSTMSFYAERQNYISRWGKPKCTFVFAVTPLLAQVPNTLHSRDHYSCVR